MKFLLTIVSSIGLLVISSSHSCAQENKNKALQQIVDTKTSSHLSKLIDAQTWNALFPNRNNIKGKDSNHPDFYSYQAFLKATSHFPGFLNEGTTEDQKRELAAFLANIAQETSGGWDAAPGGYFKWGLYFIEENNKGNGNNYSDASKVNYPPVEGQNYYGRGPKQLSWNYNYGQFSEAWFGDKNVLLKNPALLANDNVLSFASAIWFWMTPQYPKPSCHDVMIGKWTPTEKDKEGGRTPGFGATVNIINGGIECGQQNTQPKTKYRYEYYQYFCKYFKVNPGENISCSSQKPFGT
ncbi:chitinase [Elizabethkingia meningoseptica]|uniref:chitinase n=1 Tax=Elizabethkingia meningoseptica TaxID=238 RepID=UPI00099923D4|nr:chitinase [Elizabethkingia meningoseptica]EJK5329894.1 chitinase [Elizabethkingia meningoseptica]MDE5432305.1 chitinase [Elizabethkingia meningoseptica]MDE5439141.1 chitinase [Elizabethkingia meningoseptica]MDE5509300.1 chitinase [Elizabethkingia meningoseptica]MDE5516731.1 chitinase [Elizabethkingia meningoseptica]